MEDYVSYEQAVKLKELGFDWTSYNYYDNDGSFITTSHDEYYSEFEGRTTAPTLAQVQKWLREVKGIDVHYHYGRKKWTYYWGRRWSQALYEKEYDTPIEALSAGIDKVLEFLNSNDSGLGQQYKTVHL